MKYRQRTTCRLCNNDKLAAVLHLPPTPLANSFMKTREESVALEKFPLDVNCCERCGHHQLGTVVDPKLMFQNYAYASGTAQSFRQHFKEYAEEIVRRFPDTNSFLEVGSNDGTMLHAMYNAAKCSRSAEVFGVEPAENLVKQCLKEGLNVSHGFFSEKLVNERRLFNMDFWTANNVLAHINDFVGTLNALALTGAKAGAFEVQYLGSLLDGGMFDMTYHEHVSYWRATELVNHLHEHTPWAVVDIELVPTHGGSLRVWVERSGEVPTRPHLHPDFRVYHFIETESRRDWAMSWGVLKEKMDAERERLRSLLEGKRVVIYGAPAKLTTLLYGLGLNKGVDFAYVVDDSPLKQGLFTPGTGLPVVGVDHLKRHAKGGGTVDTVLVGAWNFAEGIVMRLREMGFEHNQIVVPFEQAEK